WLTSTSRLSRRTSRQITPHSRGWSCPWGRSLPGRDQSGGWRRRGQAPAQHGPEAYWRRRRRLLLRPRQRWCASAWHRGPARGGHRPADPPRNRGDDRLGAGSASAGRRGVTTTTTRRSSVARYDVAIVGG